MGVLDFFVAFCFSTAYYIITHEDSVNEFLKATRIFLLDKIWFLRPKHNKNFNPAERDKEYISESKRVLFETLGEDPLRTILDESDGEERTRMIENLVSNLAKLYEIPNLTLEFYHDDNTPVAGMYEHEKNKIYLNTSSLMTDNRYLVRTFLDTVFHEFRHAVQWQNIQINSARDYKWYLGEEPARKFAEGYINYITYEKDPEGYKKQFIEVDAREMALYIVEDL